MSDQKQIIEGYDIIEETFCSNFDGVINVLVAERMKHEKICAFYPAWDWHGTVWYEDGNYYCRVMQLRCPVGVLSAPTPQELQKILCDKYGND